MKNLAFTLCAALLFALAVGCAKQRTTLIKTDTTHLYNPISQIPAYDLMMPLDGKPELDPVVKNAQFFKLDEQELDRLWADQPAQFVLKLPDAQGIPAEIVFDKKQVASPGFRLIDQDGRELPVQPGIHYRQTTEDSYKAAISIFEKQFSAIVATASGDFSLSELTSSPGEYILFKEDDLNEKEGPFTCTPLYPEDYAMPKYGDYHQFSAKKTAADADPTDPVVRVYVECDNELLAMTGGTVQGVYQYVTTLFNYTALVYEVENITLQMSEMLVWTELDPYNVFEPLTAFAIRWQEAQRNFNGDLAHLLRGYASGGTAWVDMLCNPDLPYGQSGMGNANWNNFPNYIYEVYVFAHELGHNLGSPHTHNCFWGPNNDQAIDNCASSEGACAPGPPPVNGGTIMSYCGGFNLLNGFGPEPGDLVRMRVANAPCLKNLQYYNTCQLDSIVVMTECLPDPTPTNPMDNQYNIRFNVKGTGAPMTLRAIDTRSGQTWLFSHNSDILIGPFLANESYRTIQIEDLSNPACLTERVIFPSSDCYRPDQCAPFVFGKSVAGSNYEAYNAVAAFNDGSIIGTGRVESDDGDFTPTESIDFFVVKYDASGNKLWLKQFGGESHDESLDLLPMPDGGAVVLGSTWSSTGFGTGQMGGGDAFAMRLDANGNQVWKHFYGGTWDDRFHCAALLPGGDMVFGGVAWSNDGDISGNQGGGDAWLIRVNPNGGVVWSKLYGDVKWNTFENISLGNNGAFALSGFYENSNGITEQWAAEISNNGTVNWQRQYPAFINGNDKGLFANDNGGYLLLYQTDRPLASRLDANGNLLQTRQIIERGGFTFEDADKLPGNRIAAAGWRNGFAGVQGSDPTSRDFWIYVMDGNGNHIWDKTFGEHRTENAYCLAPTPEGGFVLGGNLENNASNSYDAWITKLGADFCSDPNLCSITATFSNVQCDPNGTLNDPSDDTYSFDVSVGAGGNCGTGWTAGNASGVYNTATHFGPYLIADGDKTLVIVDNNDPSITASVTVAAPFHCSFGPSYCQDNLLVNSGFEENFSQLNGWQTEGDVTVSNDPHNGNWAAQICDGTGLLTRVLPTTPGKTYTASLWVKKASSSTAYSAFTLRFLTANWQPLSSDAEVITNTEYQQFVQTETAPPTAAYVQVLLFKEAGGCLITDDWELCESSGQPCSISAQVSDINCDDNGTPNNPNDDSFGFTILANNPAQSTGYQIVIPALGINDHALYGIPKTFWSINISVGPLTLNLTDDSDLNCTATAHVTPPPPCSNGGTLPDLVLTSFLAIRPTSGGSAVIVPNDQIAAGTVINFPDHGATLDFPVQVPTFTLTIAAYLSANATLDGNDVLITSGTRLIDQNVQNGGFTEGSFGSGPIPAGTAPGNYFIIVKYDATDALAEVDETNNFKTLPIVVTAGPGGSIDLEMSMLQLTANPVIYSVYDVKATVENKGSKPATGVKVSFKKTIGVVYQGGNEWSATQGTFNPHGNEEWTVGTIPAGGSATLTVRYFLLQNGAPDAYSQVVAANETDPDSTPNNGTPPTPNEDDEASTGGSQPPILTPDLTISNLVIGNAPIMPGQVLTYNFDLANIGNGAATGNFVVKAWISTQSIFNTSGIQDGIVPTGNFIAGYSVSAVPGASTIPANLTTGQYYLHLWLDADEQVGEINESNNFATAAFVVQSDQQPGQCDEFIGAGIVHCVTDVPTDQVQVLYQGSNGINKALVDEAGELIYNQFAYPVEDIVYQVNNGSLEKKLNGNVVYSHPIPAAIESQYGFVTSFTEMGSEFVLFTYKIVDSTLYAVRTNANLAVQQAVFVYKNYASQPPIVNSALQIASHNIAFVLRSWPSSPNYEKNELFIMDNNLVVTDVETLTANIFLGSAQLKPNFCGAFNLTIFRQLGFCTHGSCYEQEQQQVHFENGLLVKDASYIIGENSAFGQGTRYQSWFLRTDDGGELTGSLIQPFQIFVNPPISNIVHLKKTLNGVVQWEKDVEVSSAAGLRRLAYAGDELVFVSEKNNSVIYETLGCLEDNTQPPTGCDAITITSGPSKITIAGFNAPHVLIKVFRPNWTVAFECLDNCANPLTIGGLTNGNHNVEILLLDASWNQICRINETVNVSSFGNGGSTALRWKDERQRLAFDNIYPNPAQYWVILDIHSREAQAATLDFYNQQGQLVRTLDVQLKQGRNEVEMQVEDWRSGTYNVIGRGEKGLPAYGRFLKVWE